jgi:KipI family sensor histidine kinase inhibitor
MRLLALLDAAHLPGVVDLVPAYASVLVRFDPRVTDAAAIEVALHSMPGVDIRGFSQRTRLVRIPVRYGDAEGPDLAAVAQQVGLSPAEVIRLHTSAIQRVYFIGFLAGYPYLGNLPPALAVPRLPIPRTRVPAGSVGIAGRQTGIYPVASPGGWHLIGRSEVSLFDPTQDPPALLRPGDRVRFVPVERGANEPDTGALAPWAPSISSAVAPTPGTGNATAPPSAPVEPARVPWLRVIQPGAQTTVQDAGRYGYARYGVVVAGAADRLAFALGNQLLGNPPDAAALELTYGAATFETRAASAIAVTGAACPILVDGTPRPLATVLEVAAGVTIALGTVRSGVRTYLCVAGGVGVPAVLGSRSTDLRAGFGGFAGRALCAGDALDRGATRGLHPLARHVPGERHLFAGAPGARAVAAPVVLRVLPGPHAAAYPRDLAALLDTAFIVDPRSDRAGVRLRPVGPDDRGAATPKAPIGGEVLSEGVPDGAIQLPPAGEPILLLADHQTTGGYHIPAVVISADQWRGAQLRPGDTLRFALVTPALARDALRVPPDLYVQQEADQQAADHLQGCVPGIPDPALLVRGFAEGSEGDSDDE